MSVSALKGVCILVSYGYLTVIIWVLITCHTAVLEKGSQILKHHKLGQRYGETPPPHKLCDKPEATGFLSVNLTVPSSRHNIPSVLASEPLVQPGGHWRPENCTSRSRLAVVMSYRNREDNLKRMLQHLHPFLQRQRIEYQMFVVEPVKNRTFNRGLLKNIGFLEAINSGRFGCVVFQDVDLYPENDRNSYHCHPMPHHLVVGIDTFRYRPLAGGAIFGGAVLFRREHFLAVNGYSNLYFTWGAEDDDLLSRVKARGLYITRPHPADGSYVEAKHHKDSRTWVNSHLFYRGMSRGRQLSDGLSTIHYKVVDRKSYPAYTWINVDFDEDAYARQISAILADNEGKMKMFNNHSSMGQLENAYKAIKKAHLVQENHDSQRPNKTSV